MKTTAPTIDAPSAPPPRATRNVVGRRLGGYTVGAPLGEGGFGTVYEAHDAATGEDVAIKVLDPSASDESRARFEREAEILERLHHPNIVRYRRHGEHDELGAYLIMDRVQGETLAARLRDRERLPPWEATRIAIAILEGVAAAHAEKVIHRDLKPANIMLSGEAVRVLDFGIAQPVGDDEEKLTRDGVVPCTPEYMAPERIHQDARYASDQYAVGVMLFEMISGRVPFRKNKATATALAHRSDSIPPLPDTLGVPSELAELVRRALAKDPTERFGSATAMAEALRALPLESPPGLAPTAELTVDARASTDGLDAVSGPPTPEPAPPESGLPRRRTLPVDAERPPPVDAAVTPAQRSRRVILSAVAAVAVVGALAALIVDRRAPNAQRPLASTTPEKITIESRLLPAATPPPEVADPVLAADAALADAAPPDPVLADAERRDIAPPATRQPHPPPDPPRATPTRAVRRAAAPARKTPAPSARDAGPSNTASASAADASIGRARDLTLW